MIYDVPFRLFGHILTVQHGDIMIPYQFLTNLAQSLPTVGTHQFVNMLTVRRGNQKLARLRIPELTQSQHGFTWQPSRVHPTDKLLPDGVLEFRRDLPFPADQSC